MSKQDRQGARTVSDLERKYAFKKSFSAVMGIASDSQNAATQASKAVENLDSMLNQLEVYNRLTKNGTAKALRLDDNGNIFVAAESIEGTLTQTDAPKNSTDVANKQYVDETVNDAPVLIGSGNVSISSSGANSATLKLTKQLSEYARVIIKTTSVEASGSDGKIYVGVGNSNIGHIVLATHTSSANGGGIIDYSIMGNKIYGINYENGYGVSASYTSANDSVVFTCSGTIEYSAAVEVYGVFKRQ